MHTLRFYLKLPKLLVLSELKKFSSEEMQLYLLWWIYCLFGQRIKFSPVGAIEQGSGFAIWAIWIQKGFFWCLPLDFPNVPTSVLIAIYNTWLTMPNRHVPRVIQVASPDICCMTGNKIYKSLNILGGIVSPLLTMKVFLYFIWNLKYIFLMKKLFSSCINMGNNFSVG